MTGSYHVKTVNTFSDATSSKVIEIPNKSVIYRLLDQNNGVKIKENRATVLPENKGLGVIGRTGISVGTDTVSWEWTFSHVGTIYLGIKQLSEDINSTNTYSRQFTIHQYDQKNDKSTGDRVLYELVGTTLTVSYYSLFLPNGSETTIVDLSSINGLTIYPWFMGTGTDMILTLHKHLSGFLELTDSGELTITASKISILGDFNVSSSDPVSLPDVLVTKDLTVNESMRLRATDGNYYNMTTPNIGLDTYVLTTNGAGSTYWAATKNIFDQNLNTTNEVSFNKMSITGSNGFISKDSNINLSLNSSGSVRVDAVKLLIEPTTAIDSYIDLQSNNKNVYTRYSNTTSSFFVGIDSGDLNSLVLKNFSNNKGLAISSEVSATTGQLKLSETSGSVNLKVDPALAINYDLIFPSIAPEHHGDTLQYDPATGKLIWVEINSLSKEPVRCATLCNIDLTGVHIIDGISVVNDDRVAVIAQSSSVNNGIYIVNSSGAWTRAPDTSTGKSIGGASFVVKEGNTYSNQLFVCTSNAPNDIVGTNILTFVSTYQKQSKNTNELTFDSSTLVGEWTNTDSSMLMVSATNIATTYLAKRRIFNTSSTNHTFSIRVDCYASTLADTSYIGLKNNSAADLTGFTGFNIANPATFYLNGVSQGVSSINTSQAQVLSFTILNGALTVVDGTNTFNSTLTSTGDHFISFVTILTTVPVPVPQIVITIPSVSGQAYSSVKLRSSEGSSNDIYYLPSSVGTDGQFLTTSAAGQLSWKSTASNEFSVRLATNGNITLDNTTTRVDGVTIANNDRILVMAQSNGIENGIYTASTTTAWTRDDLFTGSVGNTSIHIGEGSVNNRRVAICTNTIGTNDVVAVDSLSFTFLQAKNPYQSVNQSNAPTFASLRMNGGKWLSTCWETIYDDNNQYEEYVRGITSIGSDTLIIPTSARKFMIKSKEYVMTYDKSGTSVRRRFTIKIASKAKASAWTGSLWVGAVNETNTTNRNSTGLSYTGFSGFNINTTSTNQVYVLGSIQTGSTYLPDNDSQIIMEVLSSPDLNQMSIYNPDTGFTTYNTLDPFANPSNIYPCIIGDIDSGNPPTENIIITLSVDSAYYSTVPTTGSIELRPYSGTNYTKYYFPHDGISNQVLTTDGAGNLSWNSVSINKVRCATNFNIDLTVNGSYQIDGITLVDNDLVLIKNQTIGTENGIYQYTTASWTRATGFTTGTSISGANVLILEGDKNGGEEYMCINVDGSDVIDTHALTFASISNENNQETNNYDTPTFSKVIINTTPDLYNWSSTTNPVSIDTSVIKNDTVKINFGTVKSYITTSPILLSSATPGSDVEVTFKFHAVSQTDYDDRLAVGVSKTVSFNDFTGIKIRYTAPSTWYKDSAQSTLTGIAFSTTEYLEVRMVFKVSGNVEVYQNGVLLHTENLGIDYDATYYPAIASVSNTNSSNFVTAQITSVIPQNSYSLITFKSGSTTGVNTEYILPSDGAKGQSLTTDGSGNLSWTTVDTIKVDYATTFNIPLFADSHEIDGFTLVTNNYVLVKDQTTGSQNGIYKYTTGLGLHDRVPEMFNNSSASGIKCVVMKGNFNKDKLFYVSNQSGSDVVGTDSLVFTELSNKTNQNNNTYDKPMYGSLKIDTSSLVKQFSDNGTTLSSYASLNDTVTIQFDVDARYPTEGNLFSSSNTISSSVELEFKLHTFNSSDFDGIDSKLAVGLLNTNSGQTINDFIGLTIKETGLEWLNLGSTTAVTGTITDKTFVVINLVFETNGNVSITINGSSFGTVTNGITYGTAYAPAIASLTSSGAGVFATVSITRVIPDVYYDTLEFKSSHNNSITSYTFPSDGSVNQSLVTDGVGNLSWSFKKTITTLDPSAEDDADQKYSVGSLWLNTTAKRSFICIDTTVGNAVWKKLDTTVIADLATTTNISNFTGFQSIDGIAAPTTDGLVILVKDQTNAVENGLYVMKSGAWLRSSALPAGASAFGFQVYVIYGSANSGLIFKCITQPPIDTVDSFSISFVKFRNHTVNNYEATSIPISTDDITKGYTPGSIWVDITNNKFYICVSNASGSAIWSSGGVTNNYSGLNAPTALDDSSKSYEIGSKWVVPNKEDGYICMDSTAGNAVWKKLDSGYIAQFATTGNITLTGYKSIDGSLTPSQDDTIILVKDQTVKTQNGIYVMKSGAWVRSNALPSGANAHHFQVYVEYGLVNSEKNFKCVNEEGSAVVDTNDLLFEAYANTPLHSYEKTTNPTVNDDSSVGYSVGSFWYNNTTRKKWVCHSSVVGDAQWTKVKTQINADVATTANITLSGYQGLDSQSAPSTDGTLVLVKNQTTASENGLYIMKTGAWSRASLVSAGDSVFNLEVYVNTGTINGEKLFRCISENGSDIVGTNDLLFVDDTISPYNNLTALTNPLATDSSVYGYSVGSVWINTVSKEQFVCVDNTPANALWKKLDTRVEVRLATTADVTLDSNQTLDGIATVNGDLVLVKDQATATQNGIYNVNSTGAWTRSTALPSTASASQFKISVRSGNTLAGLNFKCVSVSGSDVVDTNDLSFVPFDNPALNNYTATVDPTVTTDITKGYSKGSTYINVTTGNSFICLDETTGSAIWSLVKSSITADTRTTTNITLTGQQTTESGSSLTDEIVLVMAQTDATQNGIYIAKGGTDTWVRLSNFNTGAAVNSFVVFVKRQIILSVEYGNKFYKCVSPVGSDVVGTHDINFSEWDNPLVNNFNAITDPTSNDDGLKGYNIGSIWINTLARKKYVMFSALTGTAIWKKVDFITEIDVATTANITLTGYQGLDGQSAPTTDGTLVLVKDQTVASENGIYIMKAGAWSRSALLDTGVSANGIQFYIKNGTVNSGINFACVSQSGSDVVDTDPLIFSKFNNPILHNYEGTTSPNNTDDITKGYSIGSVWIDTAGNLSYTCVDNSTGAAVWSAGGGSSGSNTISTYLQAHLTNDQSMSGSSDTNVQFGSFTGDITNDNSTGFTLVSGKKYKIEFTPHIKNLSSQYDCKWGIRPTSGGADLIPFQGKTGVGLQKEICSGPLSTPTGVSSEVNLSTQNVSPLVQSPLGMWNQNSTSCVTIKKSGVYRVLAYVIYDGQGGQGGCIVKVYSNGVLKFYGESQHASSEMERDTVTISKVSAFSLNETITVTVSRYFNASIDITEAHLEVESVEEYSTGSGTFSAIVSPTVTQSYSIYRSNPSNNDALCTLSGLNSGANATSLSIVELSYSSFNPSKEFAKFSINGWGVNGASSGVGFVTESSEFTTADHVKWDSVVGYGIAGQGSTSTGSYNSGLLEISGQSGSPSSGFSSGNISLDTTTAYTTTDGSQSIGRILLKANKWYRIEAMVNTAVNVPSNTSVTDGGTTTFQQGRTASIYTTTASGSTRIGTPCFISPRGKWLSSSISSTRNISLSNNINWESPNSSSGLTFTTTTGTDAYKFIQIPANTVVEITVNLRIDGNGLSGQFYADYAIKKGSTTVGRLVLESMNNGTTYSALSSQTIVVEFTTADTIYVQLAAGSTGQLDTGSSIVIKELSDSNGVSTPAKAHFKPSSDTLIEVKFDKAFDTNVYSSVSLFGDGYEEIQPSYLLVEVLEASPSEASFTGASQSTQGTIGLVPAPQIGYEHSLLKGDGTWSLNNYDATTAPSGSNDVTEGYTVGSVWIDTVADLTYTCVDNTTGSAIWLGSNSKGSIENEYLILELNSDQTSVGPGTTIQFSQLKNNQSSSGSSSTSNIIFSGNQALLKQGNTYEIKAVLQLNHVSPHIGYGIYNSTNSTFISNLVVSKKHIWYASIFVNDVSGTTGNLTANGFVSSATANNTAVGGAASRVFVTFLETLPVAPVVVGSIRSNRSFDTNDNDIYTPVIQNVSTTGFELFIEESSAVAQSIWFDCTISLGINESEATKSIATAIITPSQDTTVYVSTLSGTVPTYSTNYGTVNTINKDGSYLSIKKLGGVSYNPVNDHAHFTRASNQTSGSFNANDVIVLDTVITNVGTNISINTSTGIVTLQPSRTYKVTASLGFIAGPSATYLYAGLYNITSGNEIGTRTGLKTTTQANDNAYNGAHAIAYIRPDVITQIDFRVLSSSTGATQIGEAASNLFPEMTVEVIEGQAQGNTFTGASSVSNGSTGVVPAPEAGYQDATLKGDSTWLRNNTTSTTDPLVSNDSSQGYNTGSKWVNTNLEMKKLFIMSDPTQGAARWLPMPVLIYSLEAVNISDSSSAPQDTDFINLEYISTTGGTGGFRNYSTSNAVPNTAQYPNLTNARVEYDPYFVRGSGGTGQRNSGELYLVQKCGTGNYMVTAEIYRPNDNTTARFSTNSLSQSGGGDIRIGIQIGQTGAVIDNRTVNNVEWGERQDSGSGVPDSSRFCSVKQINIDPLRFIVSLSVGNAEESYFKFSVIKYS